MGFSDVEDLEPVQTLELTPDDFVSDNSTPLKFVRFQRVSSLTVSSRQCEALTMLC
jgi:hypothetical protein